MNTLLCRLQGAHGGDDGGAGSTAGAAAVAVPDHAVHVRLRRHRGRTRRATDAAHLFQTLRN